MNEFIGKEYNATIDVKDSKLNVVQKGIQIFIGDSVKFHISLTDGKDTPKDLTNISKVKAYYKREDSTLVEQELGIEVVNPIEGKVDVIVDKDVVSCPSDKISMAIRLIDEDELITSTTIGFKVVKAIDSDIFEQSKDKIATLDNLVLQIEKSENAINDVNADIAQLDSKVQSTNERIDTMISDTEDDVTALENRINAVNQEMDEEFLRITELPKEIVDGRVCFKISSRNIENWIGKSFQIAISGRVDLANIINSCILYLTVAKNVNSNNKNVAKLIYESRLDIPLANNRICGCSCVWENDSSEIPSNYPTPSFVLIKTRFNEVNISECHAYISKLNY